MISKSNEEVWSYNITIGYESKDCDIRRDRAWIFTAMFNPQPVLIDFAYLKIDRTREDSCSALIKWKRA